MELEKRLELPAGETNSEQAESKRVLSGAEGSAIILTGDYRQIVNADRSRQDGRLK